MKKFLFPVILIGLAAGNASADEGMFLLNKLDKLDWKKLKSMGLVMKPGEIVTGAEGKGIDQAIIQLGGGTGEFVSAEGLILTNHHVAFGAIQENSTAANDLITNGFHAKTKAEELKSSYSGRLTEKVLDVTSRVKAALDTCKTLESREAAFKAISDTITKKYTEFPERNARVVPMNDGNEYVLFVLRNFGDIRLVYAPPRSIGEYGGEVDNWMWPRHTGDFSMMRAYAAKDGKTSGKYSEGNVPFVPKRFLKISASGIKENDVTLIMGYPGRTTRYRTSIETAFALNYSYPQTIAALNAGIKGMEEAYQNDKELEIEYASIVKSYMNSLKNFEGNIAGLSKNGLIAQKQAEEKAFMEWVSKDPARKAKYGNLLNEFSGWYQKLEAKNQKNTVVQWVNRSRWFSLANSLNKSISKLAGQPMAEDIKASFIEANMETFLEVNPKIEKNILRNNLKLAFALPENQALALSLLPGLSADQSADQIASGVVNALKLGDKAGFTALLEEIASGKTPENDALKLAAAIQAELSSVTAFTGEFNRNLSELRRLLIEGMMAFKGKYFYPDANSTIRFSYGSVKGYNPRDAVSYGYITKFSGVIEKESGEEPFANPKKLIDLHKTKDLGSYTDKKLGDVPVAFLTTNDITGGNSGSPVLNGKGELIGCAFDGVWEALTGDWKFEDANNRTIAVDSRYVLFILDKFSGAKNILDELTIVK